MPSPRYDEAVFVLLEVKETTTGDIHTPTATATAVECSTNNGFLTCWHCIVADSAEKIVDRDIIYLELAVTLHVHKAVGGVGFTFSSPIIPVEVIAHNRSNDWAVLRRTDKVQCSKVIPICPANSLPDTHKEEQVKYYSYPVAEFLETGDPYLTCEPSDYMKVSTYTHHHVKTPVGNVSGSSGGAVVDRAGRLVGIHQESCNSIKRFADEQGTKKFKAGEHRAVVEDCLNSVSNSYRNYFYALVPCRMEKLMHVLTNMASYPIDEE